MCSKPPAGLRNNMCKPVYEAPRHGQSLVASLFKRSSAAMRRPKKMRVASHGQPQRKISPAIPYMLDPTVIPRVQAYSQTNPLSDIDTVVKGLQQLHKDYRRKPQAALKQAVWKAIQFLKANKPQRYKHLEPTHGSSAFDDYSQVADGAQSDVSSSSNDSSLADSDVDTDHTYYNEQDSGQHPEHQAGMNSMLLSMYARTPQLPAYDMNNRGCQKPFGQNDTTTTPAFVPAAQTVRNAGQGIKHQSSVTAAEGQATIHKVMAAATTIVSTGATDQHSQGQQQQQDVAATDSAELARQAPLPSTTTPATKANVRTAAVAGLPQDARGARTVKRVRRLGTNANALSGAGGAATPRPAQGSGGGLGGSAVATPRPVTYEDLGGVEDILWSIHRYIERPLLHPEFYSKIGTDPPRGVLLHGPPGCGKTALANAIANMCNVPFLKVSAPEIVSGMSGESEANLRSLFKEAADRAPCIVFIDDLSSIPPIMTQGQSHHVDKQHEAGSQPSSSNKSRTKVKRYSRPHVAVIGATNRPDAIDPALRRAGRFDKEIKLGIPTPEARAKILEVITRDMALKGDIDFHLIAKRTPGFVGADLVALVKEAAELAIDRMSKLLETVPAVPKPIAIVNQSATTTGGYTSAGSVIASISGTGTTGCVEQSGLSEHVTSENNDKHGTGTATSSDTAQAVRPRFGAGPLQPEEMPDLAITMSDLMEAVQKVQPSVKREGFTATPDVTWDDVGSLDEIREELSFAITYPILHPEAFERLGMKKGAGVLLCGPPGCGKTLLAKAVANESGANFISIRGPELLNKYVGESERAVRQLFARARAAQPCVIFFDELDALAPKRGTDNNQAAERVLLQLLTEMDGVGDRQGIYIVAATNKPETIDIALLRPGRLGSVLYVPLPSPDGRVSILRTLTRQKPLADDVDIIAIGLDERCEGLSGADLEGLVDRASAQALKEHMQSTGTILARKDEVFSSTVTTASSTAAAADKQPEPELLVAMRHFQSALKRLKPSVSKSDARDFEAMRDALCRNRRLEQSSPA